MKRDKQSTSIYMEKKSLYSAPAVRYLALGFDSSFLVSATTGASIDPWQEDSDEITF
jgi:hypothetical protein